MHVTSLTSKRCATITYCHTLVRPAFCPFCLGNQGEPASRRWESWTREAKLWAHLWTHLDVSVGSAPPASAPSELTKEVLSSREDRTSLRNLMRFSRRDDMVQMPEASLADLSMVRHAFFPQFHRCLYYRP